MKDTDEFIRALRWRTLPYAVIGAGLFVAAAIVMKAAVSTVIVGGIITLLVAWWAPLVLAEKSGNVGASIFMTSGSSTPAIREYSLAEALIARGSLNEAAEAYEVLAGENPDDAEPATRLARLLRDKLARFEDAAVWFRKALAVPGLEPQTEVALLRELSELYTHKLRQPTQALPYLGRLASRHAGNPAAQWARTEAAEIRRGMLKEASGLSGESHD